MATSNGRAPSMRIIDVSDRELLTILGDLEATEGYVDVHDVAAEFWPKACADPDSGEAIHARRCVSQRLTWLGREAGLVEKHETERRWRLSRDGERFLAAKLRANQVKAIGDAADDQLPELTAALGDRYRHVSHEAAWLTRREWQYRTARR